MKYDLIITDYDGTLGNGDFVDEQTIKAIEEYKRRGGKFVVCSGRLYFSIKHTLQLNGLDGIVAACQGALIKDIKSEETYLFGGIDKKNCVEVVKTLERDKVKAVLCSERALYYTEYSNYVSFYEKYEGKAIKVKSLYDQIENGEDKIQKIIASLTRETMPYYLERYRNQNISGVEVNSGADTIVEFISADYSKGKAVEFLAKHFNIPLERVMTVGDSTNDITLIQGPWHGVAVGGAVDELKKVAKEVAPSFNDNPILYLLNKYCLQ